MPTAEAVYTLERHRADQLALRTLLLYEAATLWPLLDPFRLDETAPAWIQAMVRLISEQRRRSSAIAIEFYEAYRSYETGLPSPSFRDRIDLDDVPREAFETSMRTLGPIGIKKRIGLGAFREEAQDKAFVQVAASAARHTLDGARTTTLDLSKYDDLSVRWARVTGPNPCYFCAMLASRGPVYHTRKTAGDGVNDRFEGKGLFKFHDNCQCLIAPVFTEGDDWPGRGREYEQAWQELSRELGYSPSIQEWRKFYNERFGPGVED